MKCPYCGADIPEKAQTCPKCCAGIPVEEPKEQQKAAVKEKE